MTDELDGLLDEGIGPRAERELRERGVLHGDTARALLATLRGNPGNPDAIPSPAVAEAVDKLRVPAGCHATFVDGVPCTAGQLAGGVRWHIVDTRRGTACLACGEELPPLPAPSGPVPERGVITVQPSARSFSERLVERLTSALRPFAAYAASLQNEEDERVIVCYMHGGKVANFLTAGELRTAKQLVEEVDAGERSMPLQRTAPAGTTVPA